METKRDIYSTPEPDAPSGQGTSNPELNPAQLRAKTWRSTAAFTAIMLILFGGAIWLVIEQEKKNDELEGAQKGSGTAALLPMPVVTSGLDAVRAASHPTYGSSATAPAPASWVTNAPPTSGQPEPTTIEPERMAQAMAEIRLGNDFLRARDLDKAEIHARKALDLRPDMNAALRLLGVVYTHRGQFDQAIVLLEQAQKQEPFNPETYNNLATAYMQKGMMDKSEELLETCLQIAPNYSAAYLNLGLMYLLKKQYDAAAENLEKGIERMPNDAAPRNNLAVALMRLGRYDEARRQLQVVVKLSPNIPDAYFNYAITYVLEKKYDDAMVWIRKGSEHCSAVTCRKFLSDSDFNAMRGHPDFQRMINSLFPNLPAPPKG